MRSQLYLHSQIRQKYINQIKWIYDLYVERIEPTFANPEEEAYEYMDKLSRDMMYSSAAEDDPNGCLQTIYDFGVEHFEILSSMQFRTLGMWISCMSQVWEQQLYSFIMHEATMEGIVYVDNDATFAFSDEVLKAHSIYYGRIQHGIIDEMRDVVNVLKHGQGPSEKRLRKKRPELFIRDGRDVLANNNATLLEPSLQITTEDFKKYCDALIEFWEKVPEYVYSKDDYIR